MTVLMVLLHVALVAGVVIAVGISERRPGLCCAIWAAATAFWVCGQVALGLFSAAILQLCTFAGILYLTVGSRSSRSASPSQDPAPGPAAPTLAETAAPAGATQQHPTAPPPTSPSP